MGAFGREWEESLIQGKKEDGEISKSRDSFKSHKGTLFYNLT